MTRTLQLALVSLLILLLWMLSMLLVTSSNIDPAIWNQYVSSDLRGH